MRIPHIYHALLLLFILAFHFKRTQATERGVDFSRAIQSSIQIPQLQDEGMLRRRTLGVMDMKTPGSKPPNCTSKCSKCTPCTPIRMPVQPGPHKTSEYYPEAWRCKCKGQLFQP